MDTPHDIFTDRLSDYLDGGLAARETRELEQHLGTCAACSTTLADLRLVVARARELPASVPVADLWPAIEARLATSDASDVAVLPERADGRAPKVLDLRSHPRWWQRPLTFSLAQVAAAAVLLVVLAGGGAWFAFQAQPQRVVARDGDVAVQSHQAEPAPAPAQTTTPEPEPAATGPVASTVSEPARRDSRPAPTAARQPDAVAASAVSLDPRYDATVAELQQLLIHERANLDTSTVRILEQNLALVDRALAEAQRAVAADPNNPQLRSYLASTMRRKVDLLRRATVIAGAQG